MADSASSGRVVITGGGTAGHVLPAVAVADALVEAGRPPEEICFYGSRRGMETRLVPEAGYSVRALPGRGIVRRLARSNLRALGGLVRATAMVAAEFARDRPGVVVTVGGYASAPVVAAAWALSVPIVVVNVDAVPGLANRIAGRIARVSAVAFAGTALPRAVQTGAPVRRAFSEVVRTGPARCEARRALGAAERQRLVAVVGGSLGAASLNEAGIALGEAAMADRGLVVHHVAGARNYEQLRRRVGHLEASGRYRLVPYSEQIPALYVAADLVVSRAGAMAVAELGAVGTPAVLVPLPGAPGDHQLRNAEEAARRGGAMILEEGRVTPDELAAEVLALARDEGRLAGMERAAQAAGEVRAAAAIATLIEDVTRGRVVRGRIEAGSPEEGPR